MSAPNQHERQDRLHNALDKLFCSFPQPRANELDGFIINRRRSILVNQPDPCAIRRAIDAGATGGWPIPLGEFC
jgi:hypothetical protein